MSAQTEVLEAFSGANAPRQMEYEYYYNAEHHSCVYAFDFETSVWVAEDCWEHSAPDPFVLDVGGISMVLIGLFILWYLLRPRKVSA